MLRRERGNDQEMLHERAPRGIGQPSPDQIDEAPVSHPDIREYSLPNENIDPRDNI